MPEEHLPHRTVRDFRKHYGVTRNDYIVGRLAAKINPLAETTMMSPNEQRALLRHVSRTRRADQIARRMRKEPRVTKQFARPARPERTEMDWAAEVERLSISVEKWRTALFKLAKPHVVDTDKGLCKKCRKPAPCAVRQTLNSLDVELAEQIAAWETGVHFPGDVPLPGFPPDRQVQHLRIRRDRWTRLLAKLTMDHALPNGAGKCVVCRVSAPCETMRTVEKINRGIAHRLGQLAAMTDAQFEATVGGRRESFDDEDGEIDIV